MENEEEPLVKPAVTSESENTVNSIDYELIEDIDSLYEDHENYARILTKLSEVVDDINAASDLIKEGEIKPTVLVYALAKHYSTSSRILTLYEGENYRLKNLKRRYKLVFSQWVNKVSKELNETRAKSKFASASEIEARVIVDNKEQWDSWEKKINEAEITVSFYRQLADNWASNLQVLKQLNINSGNEMKSLFAENYVNNVITKKTEQRGLKPRRVPGSN